MPIDTEAMASDETGGMRYKALIQLLRTAEDLWNASRVFFSRWDLSPSQFNVLNLLHGQKEGLSQSELSRLLIMHRSNVTGLVDRLERRRLVQREDHARDRRAYRITLAPAGIALLDQIYPHYYAAAHRVWRDTPDDRIRVLVDELRDITAQAGAVALLAATPKPDDSPESMRPRNSRAETTSGRGAPPASPAPDNPIEDTDATLRTSDL